MSTIITSLRSQIQSAIKSTIDPDSGGVPITDPSFPGLLSYYNGAVSGALLLDQSPNGYDGTNTSVTIVPDATGDSYEYNGTTSITTLPASILPSTGDLSISVWARSDVAPVSVDDRFFGAAQTADKQKLGLNFNGTGAPQKGLSVTYATSATTVNNIELVKPYAANTYYHVGVSIVGSTITVWVDDVEEYTANDAHTGTSTTKAFLGSNFLGVPGTEFDGRLSRFRTFDFGMSAAQNSTLFSEVTP